MSTKHRIVLPILLALHVAGCRLDLDASAGEETNATAEERSTSASGRSSTGRAASTDGLVGRDTDADSSLSCATAAALRVARSLPSDPSRLSGVYMISGTEKVEGNVTIEPGTIFILAADARITFGETTFDPTTLTALGTPEAPIRFCSDLPGLGRYANVTLGIGLTSDSAFENAHIYDSGAVDAALRVAAEVRLANVTVHGSRTAGISASAFGFDSQRLSIRGAQGSAAVLTGTRAVDQFPKNSTFTDNVDNTVHLKAGAFTNGSYTFHKLPIPYVAEDNLSTESATLNFEAGVEVQFLADISFNMSARGRDSEFHMNGTAAEPVVFRGAVERKGYWLGIAVPPAVSTDSTMQHVVIAHAGAKQNNALLLRSGITVQDVLISDCTTPPAIHATLRPESRNLSVTRCDAEALQTSLLASASLPRGGSFTGNTNDWIALTDLGADDLGTITVPNFGVPYLATANLKLANRSVVSFEPGVTVLFQSGYQYGIHVGNATLIARGTASAPITFRGERDQPGSWSGLGISYSASTDTVLDYVHMHNAPLTVEQPISVTNSSFSGSPTFGILKDKNDTTDYLPSNTFANNAQGEVGIR